MSFIRNSTKYNTTINSWINSFKNNNNIGVQEEIKTGLELLISHKLDTIDNLPEKYKNIHINSNLTNLLNIKGLINLTQNDDQGGTADIGIITNDDNILYFSVTHWKGKLNKCICNPSSKIVYNIDSIDPTFVKINNDSYDLALKYRKNKFGSIPNKKWKRVRKCPGTKNMNEYSAEKASYNWNQMDNSNKRLNLIKILDLDTKLNTNCDGIIYYNKKKNKIEKIYKWSLKNNLNLENCLLTINNGIYIYHYIKNSDWKDTWFLKTQAKYNNGIIEGMSSKIPIENWKPCTGDPVSSWNCVARLEKLFTMENIYIVNT